MKIKKVIGLTLYYLIGKHLPKSSSIFKIGKIFRRFCGKLMLENCGKNINIEKGACFSTKCRLGDNSGIGYKAEIGIAYIGKNVMMGPYCKIITQNHNFSRTDIPMIEQGVDSIKPVIIKDDVWIGTNVIILPGVEIGEGSILGAGSVIAKSVPPYSVCCGNPCIIKRKRK